jgi:hypothetical protein
MDDLIDDLKARARILQRQAQAGEVGALARLRRLPELKSLDDVQLRETVQRRHCLAAVAREQGFRDWSHARSVLTAEGAVSDFGTLLYPARCSAHWNIWSADYDEARAIRDDHGGYLLAYRHQFLIVDRHYLETLGLDPDDRDWERMGRDWVRPLEPAARSRLYAKLLLATSG